MQMKAGSEISGRITTTYCANEGGMKGGEKEEKGRATKGEEISWGRGKRERRKRRK